LGSFDKSFTFLFRFLKEVTAKGGVPGYRFTPPEDVFSEIEKNPENDCFCPAGPPCAPHGLFNVSLCQYGKYLFWIYSPTTARELMTQPYIEEALENLLP